MKILTKALLLALLFTPSFCFGYEFETSQPQKIAFDENKFEVLPDNFTGDNSTVILVQTDIKGLKFNVNNNAYVKDVPAEGSYLLYVGQGATEIELVAYGYYPKTITLPLLTGEKRALQIAVSTKGDNPAEYKGAFVVSSVRPNLTNNASVELSNRKPVFIVKTDLPFEKIDKAIFNEPYVFLMLYENCGPYYYVAFQADMTLQDILNPDVLTKTEDGKTVAAKNNPDFEHFLLEASTVYDMMLSRDSSSTSDIKQHAVKEITKIADKTPQKAVKKSKK